jgi:hypothetical protein
VGLITESKSWWLDSGMAEWPETLRHWAFPSGASADFGCLEEPNDILVVGARQRGDGGHQGDGLLGYPRAGAEGKASPASCQARAAPRDAGSHGEHRGTATNAASGRAKGD